MGAVAAKRARDAPEPALTATNARFRHEYVLRPRRKTFTRSRIESVHAWSFWLGLCVTVRVCPRHECVIATRVRDCDTMRDVCVRPCRNCARLIKRARMPGHARVGHHVDVVSQLSARDERDRDGGDTQPDPLRGIHALVEKASSE